MRRVIYGLRRPLLALAGLAVVAAVLLGVVIIGTRATVTHNVKETYAGLGLGVLGALVLTGVAARLGSPLPRRLILELDLTQPLPDHVSDDPVGRLLSTGGPKLTVREAVDTLERAARDRRVTGLLVRLSQPATGLGTAQELRDAIVAFRSSGKVAVAFADTFGEFANGTLPYYVATGCDEIWLQPSGDVSITGVMGQAFFVKGAFDKLGIVHQGDRRYEFKSAHETFTETQMSPAAREATGRVVESWFEQVSAAIADARGYTRDQAVKLLDAGPHLAQDALDERLVDRLAYHDEVVDAVKERMAAKQLLYLDVYRRRARPRTRGQTVAVIHGYGAVVRGKGGFNPMTGTSLGADTVAGAFRKAIADKRVKAILFRVDSPGGSYVASDTVWRETVRARDKGKPVVVSMGNVAGSGGYFVAMAADKIVAHPGTITGSIGVLGGKDVIRGLQQKVGITTDEVHRGANATMWSAAADYTDDEWGRLEAVLDRIYDDFTMKVATGRQLPVEGVHEVAKGRIWSGADALELGLVDALGGYPEALRLIREAANLKPDAPLRLKVFPKKASPLGRVRGGDRSESSDEAAAVAVLLRAGIQAAQPAVRWAAAAGLIDQGALSMSGFVPQI